MKLQKIITISGQIVLKTGLHIGGSKDDIEIGGIDNPVIRHPLTKEPYIPGSSLKGKMRSLMEYLYGKVSNDGAPHNCADGSCPVCLLFGSSKDGWQGGPTRLIVRDAFLNRKWANDVLNKGLSYTEEKVENAINRLEGKAQHPRTMERVPAGARFDCEIGLKIFDTDKEEGLLEDVKKAMKLLELDTLGGSGSRGYGKIEFKDLKKIDGAREEEFTLPETPFEG